MAKRFHSGFKSDLGTEYDVELWDSEFSGTSEAFYLEGAGFEIRKDGDTKTLHKQKVQGSSCTFRMVIEPGTTTRIKIETLIDDLLTAQEQRFQVKITKGSSPEIIWFGNVLADISRRTDASPSVFEVVATDGLAALSKVDYNNSGTAYTGSETLLGHAVNCLTKIGSLSTFFTTEEVIATVVNWYEDSHSTGAADDPFALTRTSHLNYFTVDKFGEYVYSNCYEVLEDVLGAFEARLYMADGKYRIEQLSERANATHIERYYQKDGTYSSNATTSHDVTLDQDTEARLTAGTFNYMQPLREVVINYVAKKWNNKLPGITWSHLSSPTATTLESINHNNGNATIALSFSLSAELENLSWSSPEAVWLMFAVKIKIGSYYLRRDRTSSSNFNITYSNPVWTTSEEWYNFHLAIPENQIPTSGNTGSISPAAFNIVTPNLPESGQMDITVNYQSARKQSDGGGVGVLQLVVEWEASDSSLLVSTSGNPVLDFADVKNKSTNDNGAENSDRLTFETTLGDGPTSNTVNRLEVYDGSTWSDSSQWQIGGAGTILTLNSLRTRIILAMRKNAVRTYKGTIRGSGAQHMGFNFDGDKFMLLQGSFNANLDRWTGTWAVIGNSTADVTTVTPVSVDPGPPVTDPSNQTGPVYNPNGGPTGTANPNGTGGGLGSSGNTQGIAAGPVTSIGTTQVLNGGAFTSGQTITVVDPTNGTQTNFTVTADTQTGDTSISVQGYATNNIPAGSYIYVSPQNQTVQGFSSTSGSSSQDPEQTSNWFDIFEQWWSIDDTNDIDWPIEAPNICISTDDNAGDGSTAGVVLDGDGLQVYGSLGSTPRLWLHPDGRIRMQSPVHETFVSGIVYNYLGVLHVANNLSSTNPQHGHIHRMQVIGYNDDWATGAQTAFWRVTNEFVGYKLSRIGYGVGASLGSGTGTNEVRVYLVNSAGTITTTVETITISSTNNNLTSADTVVTLVQGDVIYFHVQSVKTTPPKGFMCDLYLTRT